MVSWRYLVKSARPHELYKVLLKPRVLAHIVLLNQNDRNLCAASEDEVTTASSSRCIPPTISYTYVPIWARAK